MSSTTESKLRALKSAIVDAKLPCCSGTLPLRAQDLVLYYGKEDNGSCRRIDFSNVDQEALKHLSNSCDKAKFGRAQEDVYDEAYRRAGKLDAVHFATKLDLEQSGLMDAVRYDLLEGHDGHRPIKAELYKLNVYGFVFQVAQGYASRHIDVRISRDHSANPARWGALTFRHNGMMWQFDSAEALRETPTPHLHIAYVSFFSDVEHAVMPVKWGHRVTLTYNLYFDEGHPTQQNKTVPANQSLVKNALRELLADETFLPDGGYIGFGLRHEYPVELKPPSTNTLDFLASNLKGIDAMVMWACRDFKLEPTLRIHYDGDSYCQDHLLVSQEPDINGQVILDSCDRPLVDRLTKVYHAKTIELCRECLDYRRHESDGPKLDFEVHWVTEMTRFNVLEAVFGTYGNEPGAEHVYGLFCLIVFIGPAGNRAMVAN